MDLFVVPTIGFDLLYALSLSQTYWLAVDRESGDAAL
jgi:hypothetical protein